MKTMKNSVKNFLKYRYLLQEIVRKNIKLQYRSSVLGVFWTFLQPLLNVLVLSVIFGALFVRNEKDFKCFAIYLLCGRLVFEFYTSSTKRAMRSIRNSAGVIKKVYVPKYIYPLANVFSSFITFLISLTVLLLFLVYYIHFTDKEIGWSHYILYSVVPFVNMFLLSIGVGMVLCVLEVFFKDIEYLYDVFCTVLFYLTPMFYMADTIFPKPTVVQKVFLFIIKANPLYGIVSSFRNCVLFSRPMQWLHIWYPFVFAMVLIGIGTLMFYKKQDEFILHI